MLDLLKFDGAPVVITGAASGIGLSCCELFTDLGAKVIAVDVDPTFGLSHHGTALGLDWPDRYYSIDVSQEAEVRQLAKEVFSDFGEIASLVNIAGVGSTGSLETMDLAHWNRIMQTNVTSMFLMVREFLPMLRENTGSVVNMSSTYAFASRSHKAAYSASKGAIVALTKAAAIEASRKGIRVNAVCPGPVMTPRRVDAGADGVDDLEKAARRTLQGRMALPGEIANLIAFLASRAASYITGSAVIIDGGQLSHIGEVT